MSLWENLKTKEDTMKIKVYTMQMNEVPQEVPQFQVGMNGHFYKIVDEKRALHVNPDNLMNIVDADLFGEECTREEFEAAFVKVHEVLLELAK